MRALWLLAMVGMFAWLAWPAEAGDEEQAQIVALQRELAQAKAEGAASQALLRRTSGEIKHLREAYNQMREQATRSTQAISAMTSSLNASRDMIAALNAARDAAQRERDLLLSDLSERPREDPARLRHDLRLEKEARAQQVAGLHKQVAELTERCNETQVLRTIAEAKLAETEEALRVALAKK